MRTLIALLLCVIATIAQAQLPPEIRRAFQTAGIPLDRVAIAVQEVKAPRPLFAHGADRAMNPASVMKLVTTFVALELLGPDYRWHTDAYLDGRLEGGVLHGDLVLKGRGDPKITSSTAAHSICRRTTPAPSTPSRCGPTTSAPMRCSSISSRRG
jgi:D-alanyl-D-alanine carboxypeptidase/D-alanyl-D-alanine-endopeptidase (penicillin-binding protein 4)